MILLDDMTYQLFIKSPCLVPEMEEVVYKLSRLLLNDLTYKHICTLNDFLKVMKNFYPDEKDHVLKGYFLGTHVREYMNRQVSFIYQSINQSAIDYLLGGNMCQCCGSVIPRISVS